MTVPAYSDPPVRHPAQLRAVVTGRQQLSATMLRLEFTSPDFVGLDHTGCADTYMKLVLADPRSGDRVMRSYTVRKHDPESGVVYIDFALHGRGGVASAWAQQVGLGELAEFRGVGGGYVPHPQAPWHLLIGDDSALPAICAAVEQLDSQAHARVLLHAESARDLLGEERPLTPLHDLSARHEMQIFSQTEEIVEAVKQAFACNDGVPHVFLHGEAAMVRTIRRILRLDFDMPLSAMSVSGYWRKGATDEQWRKQKPEWNRQIAAAESR